MKLLIIEDNLELAEAIRATLAEQGFEAETVASGRAGEELAASGEYQLVVLDVMLADHDGVELCRNLRRRGLSTPVLMLTALAATDRKISGLDAGADDYLTKPFEVEELVARVRALLRRGSAREARVLRLDDLELDLYTRRAKRREVEVELTNKEFSILRYFLLNPNRVLSRAQIASHVWDMHYDASSNVIDVYVSSLRRKLDRGFDRELIHTIKNAGYRLGVAD